MEIPPLIVVEILSASDEMTNVIEKLEEYRTIGVPHIWVLDPRRMKAYTFRDRTLEEVQELVAEDLGIRLSLSEAFDDV